MRSSPVCQSWSVHTREGISACFRCPQWKLACCHIFLLCLSEKACDYKATKTRPQLWGRVSLHYTAISFARWRLKGRTFARVSSQHVAHVISFPSVADFIVSNLWHVFTHIWPCTARHLKKKKRVPLCFNFPKFLPLNFSKYNTVKSKHRNGVLTQDYLKWVISEELVFYPLWTVDPWCNLCEVFNCAYVRDT